MTTKAAVAAPPKPVSIDYNDVVARKMKAIRQLKGMIEAKRMIKAGELSRQHRTDNGLVARLERADFVRKQARGMYAWNGGDISKDDNLIAMIDLIYPRQDRKGGIPPRQKRPYTRNSAVATVRPNFGMTDFEILAYDITSQVDDVVIMKVIARKRPAAVTTLIPEVSSAPSNGTHPTGSAF